ncbi:hypothetical protein [Gillisia sp. JM1]|uniref:hypothetical protein n=1 Tax=Gillisia sp. JM1 TaxID=1283286 RepID=UPI00047BE391|nr:hypothetical protein [Gillisia sp. JM1]
MNKEKEKEKVHNYFIITNSYMHNSISQKLMEEYGFKEEYNIFMYKYPLFKQHKKKNSKVFNKVIGIPFFKTKYKIVKWINFFIYIIYFSFIFLKNPQQGKLVIGNFLYNGNRFIANVFTHYWETIFILDEGASTLKIYEDRSKFKNKVRFIDRIFFTYQPKISLIFYTIFNLPPNQHDEIHRIENIFNIDQRRIMNKSKSLLFIGTYLVEAKLICKEDFNELLYKLKINNQNIAIIYAPHPKESYIYDNPLIKDLGIKLINSDESIEEYLLANHSDFQIIASSVSTGYFYANNILGDSVDYQTYILDIKLPSGESHLQFQSIYKAIKDKLTGLNSKEIKV